MDVMPKTYTKSQRDAVDHVVGMLDELDNKPRRLYSALRELGDAFISKDSKYKTAVLNRLDQAERAWYDQWRFEDSVAQMLNTLRRRAHDATASQAEAKWRADYVRYKTEATPEEVNAAWRTYEDGVDKMYKAAMLVIFQVVYPELDTKYAIYD